MKTHRLTRIALAASCVMPAAHAQTPVELSPVIVTGVSEPDGSQAISDYDLLTAKATAASTGELLQKVPGAYVYNGGGLSSLPMVHGLGDDRMKVTVDGMDLFPACPNHMNSPLSYIAPDSVEDVTVYATVSPVSVSSDSLGGAVIVNPAKPKFSKPGETLTDGELGGYFRSNGKGIGGNAGASLATDRFSISYTGSASKADDYTAGGNFKTSTLGLGQNASIPLDSVASTFYKAFNQQLALAMRSEAGLFEMKAGMQNIPYEGFVNQYMDMLSNKSKQFSLRYLGRVDGADIDAQVYHQRVDHYMNFGNDRMFLYPNGVNGTDLGMPMNTAADTTGIKAKVSKAVSEATLVRAGFDVEKYHLNDWWPAASVVGGGVDQSGAMGPNEYQNIHDGERDVYSVFGEIRNQITSHLDALVGIRFESVRESTGAIASAYDPTGMMYTIPAQYQIGQSRQDDNLNASAIFRYAPDSTASYELGVSRNAKAPNLYELYAWSTPGMMAGMTTPMNNFVGDGNGYVGNPGVKPEIADKLGLDANWRDVTGQAWKFRLSSYYTYVHNYIGAQCAPTSVVAMNACTPGLYNILQYVNQNASIYGADLSGEAALGQATGLGSFALNGVVSYVRGKNETTGGNLYNMMPLNMRLALTERLGSWTHAAEAQFVRAKTDVSAVQNEKVTPGYALFNVRSTYEDKRYSLSLGLDNLFNRFYYLPLGGAYIAQGVTMFLNGNGISSAVPGMGRSVDARITVRF